MNRLFEAVSLNYKNILWDYRLRTERDFKGYYHWHQICEAIFVHEGQGSIVINHHTYEIKRGMFFFFQPFQLHRIHAVVSPTTPYIRSIFYIEPNWMQQQISAFTKKMTLFSTLWQGSDRNNAFDLINHADWLEWTYDNFNRQNIGGHGDPENIAMFLLQILTVLESVSSERNILFSQDKGKNSRYSGTIMRWIEEHYQEDINLQRLAEETHLSTSYISRVFRRETGSSITDYLTARRMKQACRLLETTDLPVEEIGFRVGIPNNSYFIQIFKQVVGKTPLKFRKKL